MADVEEGKDVLSKPLGPTSDKIQDIRNGRRTQFISINSSGR